MKWILVIFTMSWNLVYAGNSSSSGLIGENRSYKLMRVGYLGQNNNQCIISKKSIIKTEDGKTISAVPFKITKSVLRVVEKYKISDRAQIEELCQNALQKDYIIKDGYQLVGCFTGIESISLPQEKETAAFLKSTLDLLCD